MDANVLVSSIVTDLLLTSEEENLVEVFSSPDVLAEVAEHAPDVWGRHGADPAYYLSQVGTYLQANEHLVTGYEPGVQSLVLPDPNDRHVLAAAIACGADAIVTWNLKDFPESYLSRLNLDAIDPDSLFVDLYDRDPARVMNVVNGVVDAKQHPPRTLSTEIQGLRRSGLDQFSARLARRYRRQDSRRI